MARTSKSKKGREVAQQDVQSSDEGQLDGSPQGHRGTSHLRTAENMLSASRKRREAKRKAIEIEHMQRVERIRAKIETFYEDRSVKLIRIQGAQWEHLGALLKWRKSIEKAIIKNTILIEQATLNLARELDTMYAARHDEIVEMDATGKAKERAKAKE